MVNLTSRALIKGGDNFAHGGYGPTLPAAAIPAFRSDVFRSDVFSVESGGLATGVECWVTYTGEGGAWRIPVPVLPVAGTTRPEASRTR